MRTLILSLQTSGKELLVGMGFSVQNHCRQGSITEPMNSYNTKHWQEPSWSLSPSEWDSRAGSLWNGHYKRYSMMNEAILVSVDQCLAKTRSLISLDFFSSNKKPLVGHCEGDPFKGYSDSREGKTILWRIYVQHKRGFMRYKVKIYG